jgi:hypothetical protein
LGRITPLTEKGNKMTKTIIETEAYEVLNSMSPGMTLDLQIERGLNDWAAQCNLGVLHYGDTKAQAEEIRDEWNESYES